MVGAAMTEVDAPPTVVTGAAMVVMVVTGADVYVVGALYVTGAAMVVMVVGATLEYMML